jgi:RES domain-containing protein
MHIFRLCKEKYTALDGYGAFLYGGRWNSPGKAVVYGAENRALAALEFLVGIEHHRELGKLVMLTIEVPEGLKHEEIPQNELPENWRQFPAPQLLAKLGDEWLQRGTACLLKVPSVHIPEEHNYLLTPRHPDFAQIKVLEQKPFQFDDRVIS